MKIVISKRSFVIFLLIIAIFAVAGSFLIIPSEPSITARYVEELPKLPIKELGNFYKLSHQSADSNGKVRIVFIGAEFCPFCASERWPLVEVLGKFGTIDGLRETKSASYNEPFLDLPTYYFIGIKYNSDYIKFDHKETGDRNFRPLERLTSEEESLFNAYNPRGSIPFLYIAGQKGVFVQVGSGFSPGTIQGLTFSSIQNDLKNNANNKVTQSIITEANIITALICYNNGNKPINVCNDPEVANLISRIR